MSILGPAPGAVDPQVFDALRRAEAQVDYLTKDLAMLRESLGLGEQAVTRLSLFHDYIGVMIVAFMVTLVTTPIMWRLAVSFGIIDRPNDPRKIHRVPIAYLGGVAVYLGLLAAIFFSYTEPFHAAVSFHQSDHLGEGLMSRGVPLSIVLGMTVIMLIGLWDDVVGIDPRAKIAGQLFAAAALAVEDVGVQVAAGVLTPIAEALGFGGWLTEFEGIRVVLLEVPLPVAIGGASHIPINLTYWVGTAIIAVFVLGGCNASNLIDGLDGLLTGVTGIAAAGLLVIALSLAMRDDGSMDSARIVLCLALLGACLGFLPHNFNPASIFLGDCGSMLMGYTTIVIILSLGDTGRTPLVLAGLIIYGIPIVDTTLAIFRRKISGRSISDADDGHLHHMLKRAAGVKGAVLILYIMGVSFALLGIGLTEGRARVTYVMVLVFASAIGVVALKIARRDHIAKLTAESEAKRFVSGRPSRASEPSDGASARAGTDASASSKADGSGSGGGNRSDAT